MKKAMFLTVLLFFSASSIVFAQEPIKVGILTWSINSYINAAVENGIIKKDDQLLKKILAETEKAINSKGGFVLSSKKFGETDEDAQKFLFPNGGIIPSVPFPAKKEIYDADLIILIQSPEKDEDKYTEIAIISVETGKEATSLIEDAKINNENLPSTIAQKVSKGLDFANDLLSIKADELSNPDMSVVRYAFTSLNNKKIFMEVDYDGAHKVVQNVALFPSERIDGNVVYELPTDKRANILITSSMKNGKVENIHIDTDFRPASDKGEPDVFFIKSDKGFPVKIIFTWEGQNIKNVNISPKDNPFPLEPLSF
ncbi:MAG: hypothetical protein Q8Q08_08785 [Candidatus Omnitrophota bacterium]|nr:hypothetical protein [Candidatus Omnitrophota bacterium]MDZ4243370.1 hypothetical protein [Candidatus Omnitrophota bacterium]